MLFALLFPFFPLCSARCEYFAQPLKSMLHFITKWKRTCTCSLHITFSLSIRSSKWTTLHNASVICCRISRLICVYCEMWETSLAAVARHTNKKALHTFVHDVVDFGLSHNCSSLATWHFCYRFTAMLHAPHTRTHTHTCSHSTQLQPCNIVTHCCCITDVIVVCVWN